MGLSRQGKRNVRRVALNEVKFHKRAVKAILEELDLVFDYFVSGGKIDDLKGHVTKPRSKWYEILTNAAEEYTDMPLDTLELQYLTNKIVTYEDEL